MYMKSLLLLVWLSILLSIACSNYKSEDSQLRANNDGATKPISGTGTASAQEKPHCALTLAAAPAIEGLKLGMSSDEVFAVFPGAKSDPEVTSFLTSRNQLGMSEAVVQPAKYAPKEDQAKPKIGEVTQITLTFLDGRVSSLNVAYNGPAWSKVDDFVGDFLKHKNLLPVAEWNTYPGMDQLRVLTCSEFEVRVFAGGQNGNLNYVLVKDLEADKKLKDRRAKARAKAAASASSTP